MGARARCGNRCGFNVLAVHAAYRVHRRRDGGRLDATENAEEIGVALPRSK